MRSPDCHTVQFSCVAYQRANLLFHTSDTTNNGTLTISSDDYFRVTESQDPLGRCLNGKFIFNSFATYSVCMNHFASLVPNHEYGCGTNCHRLCFCELSVVVFAVCEKSVVLPQPLHNNSTKIGMGSDQSYEPQHHLSRASLVVVWLSYLQTPPAPPQLICIVLVVRVVEATDVLDPAVLRAEARPPERVASHDFHRTLCVSDRSVVSGFYIGPFLCTDFLNCLLQHFVGSFWWRYRRE